MTYLICFFNKILFLPKVSTKNVCLQIWCAMTTLSTADQEFSLKKKFSYH